MPEQTCLRPQRLYPDRDGTTMAHRIVVEIEPGWHHTEIVCESDRDALCRTVCNASECEEGCVEPDAHARERVDYCNIREWIDDEGYEDTYGGGRRPFGSGWIKTWWQDGHFVWAYVTDPAIPEGAS